MSIFDRKNVSMKVLCTEGSHGITFIITGTYEKSSLKENQRFYQVYLNLYGKFWSSLPLGIDKLIKWTRLPLPLITIYMKSFETSLSNNTTMQFTMRIKIGDTNNERVSYATILSQLNKLIANGNFVMELEFLASDKSPFLSIYTTPQLILNSIKTQSNAEYNGPIPKDIREESLFPKYIRWLLLPIIFFILMIILFNSPEKMTDQLPTIIYSTPTQKEMVDLLPPCPKNLKESWLISRLEYQYLLLKASNNTNQTKFNGILNEIAAIMGRNVSNSEIGLIYNEILKQEENIGASQRIYGFFNLVNIIWFLAIIGITVSIGPCIWTITAPLRERFYYLAKYLWNNVIIPMHSYGIFEIIAYIICFLLIVDGIRYKNKGTGFYVSLTGLFGSFVSNFYSFILHCPTKPSENLYVFYNLFFSFYFIPMALFYESSLLAWLGTLCFYQAIGFSFFCDGLCYYIGFRDRKDMIKIAISSYFIGWIFVFLKVSKQMKFLFIFQSPLIIFSSILFLLALLIMTSYYYRLDYRIFNYKITYFDKQIPMLCSILSYLVIGNIYNIDGLTNTAIVFSILYLMEKYCEVHLEMNWNAWILVFMFSFIMYKIALYLHTHSEFIYSIVCYYDK